MTPKYNVVRDYEANLVLANKVDAFGWGEPDYDPGGDYDQSCFDAAKAVVDVILPTNDLAQIEDILVSWYEIAGREEDYELDALDCGQHLVTEVEALLKRAGKRTERKNNE